MRNPSRFIFSLTLMAIFQLFFADAIYATQDSSCVKCHSNEMIMKSMHKPPPAPAGEGGEG